MSCAVETSSKESKILRNGDGRFANNTNNICPTAKHYSRVGRNVACALC